MKQNKKDNFKENRKIDIPAVPTEPLWQPTWRWHLKVLTGVYIVLIAAYFAVSAFLSRVPPPYRLREVPKALTPWMK